MQDRSEGAHTGCVGIIYFSGTGNTQYIAQQYAEALAEQGQEVALRALEQGAQIIPEELASYDLLGIGYPIHAWSAPRRMAQFIRQLPPAEGQRAFLFLTADSSIGGAFDWARDVLSGLGYAVLHEARYYTDNNLCFREYPHLFTSGDSARRRAWLAADVREAVAEIVQGTERHVYASRTARFFSNLGWRFYLLGCGRIHRYFRATEACDLCGLCIQQCPTRNIRLVEGRLVFGRECTFCLRCLQVCPPDAIRVRLLGLTLAQPPCLVNLDA